MELFERVELRRFVGRELLLWIWFESEVFEATLSTKAHGAFGLWLEGRLVLSAGQETTTIKGSQPGNHREAKEALLRGKLPDSASIHISWAGQDATFTLKAEKLALAGLKLPSKQKEEKEESLLPQRPKRKAPRTSEEVEVHEAHEAFYDRMTVTREIEGIVEALYRDFLALRLAPVWDETVVPALEAWAAGEAVDDAAYKRARTRALGGGQSLATTSRARNASVNVAGN